MMEEQLRNIMDLVSDLYCMGTAAITLGQENLGDKLTSLAEAIMVEVRAIEIIHRKEFSDKIKAAQQSSQNMLNAALSVCKMKERRQELDEKEAKA